MVVHHNTTADMTPTDQALDAGTVALVGDRILIQSLR
jgi:hypothetical protein